MAAVRTGDTLVVTKLDRLARSLPDARDIAKELTGRGVRLQIGSTVHDPADPVGRLLFKVLAMVAEFEADLISARTREGLLVAKAKGRLKGKPPKLSPAQEAHLMSLVESGEHTGAEIAELFEVARSTVYRARECARSPSTLPYRPGVPDRRSAPESRARAQLPGRPNSKDVGRQSVGPGAEIR
jgi:DNA invertase Pin-like site-specific DNA recombinase